jgi:uncharacterized membrane protein HdeD (DUF308 family)
MSRMNGMTMIGAVLAVIGVLAFAIPAFTTQQNKDVAHIGDVKVTAKEETTHIVPPYVGPVALVLGLFLIGAGFYQRR